jgi:hypothetical protein
MWRRHEPQADPLLLSKRSKTFSIAGSRETNSVGELGRSSVPTPLQGSQVLKGLRAAGHKGACSTA